jgi:Protein of unknown function (DUF4238)
MDNTYAKQHTLTRAVLKRFVDPATGHLEVFELKDGSTHPAAPRDVGFVKYFIRADPAAAERRWQEIEGTLPQVFAALDDQTLLDQPDMIAVAKRCLALHAVRSLTFREVHKVSKERGMQETFEVLMQNPEELDAAFYRRTGLYSVGLGAREAEAKRQVEDAAQQLLGNGTYFKGRVEANFRQVEELLKSAMVEVIHAAEREGEFLIADDPTLALHKDRPGVGPLRGVSWRAADTIAMPLGPRHIIAAARTASWHEFDAARVRRCNEISVANAVARVFYRPGSGIRKLVEEAR